MTKYQFLHLGSVQVRTLTRKSVFDTAYTQSFVYFDTL